MEWMYKGKPFNEDITKLYGFIYLIETPEGFKYIGKKQFYSERKTKHRKRVRRETNWKDYYSSSETLNLMIQQKGKESFKREIIDLAESKGELNYLETKHLFNHDVLENPLFLNRNIMGRYFKQNIQKYKTHKIK